jgi:hypothetical protein
MLELLRRVLVFSGLLGSVSAVLILGGVLQEWRASELPDRIRAAGLRLPFDEPRLEISLQRMVLEFKDGDALIKRYDIAYGRGAPGRLGRSAQATPLGEYRVIRKLKHDDLVAHGSRFLQIDFPSPADVSRAFQSGVIEDEDYGRLMAAIQAGEPPPADTALGGPLGIHGNFFFFRERRFTGGSIALSNGDINELYESVPLGTVVAIRE